VCNIKKDFKIISNDVELLTESVSITVEASRTSRMMFMIALMID